MLKGWGLKITDLWRDDSDLSPRQVLWLLSTLGDDSAYLAARKGGEKYRGWTYDRYLQVHQAELLHNLIYVIRKINGDRKAEKPKKFWRPDDSDKKRSEGQRRFAAMVRATQSLNQIN